MDKDVSNLAVRLGEVLRGNLRPTLASGPRDMVIPEAAIPEIVECMETLQKTASVDRVLSGPPENLDAGKRISSLAAEFVAAGYMASPQSLDRLKAEFEDKLLWFVCDEMRRMQEAEKARQAA